MIFREIMEVMFGKEKQEKSEMCAFCIYTIKSYICRRVLPKSCLHTST